MFISFSVFDLILAMAFTLRLPASWLHHQAERLANEPSMLSI
jgi:hypothetical protein